MRTACLLGVAALYHVPVSQPKAATTRKEAFARKCRGWPAARRASAEGLSVGIGPGAMELTDGQSGKVSEDHRAHMSEHESAVALRLGGVPRRIKLLAEDGGIVIQPEVGGEVRRREMVPVVQGRIVQHGLGRRVRAVVVSRGVLGVVHRCRLGGCGHGHGVHVGHGHVVRHAHVHVHVGGRLLGRMLVRVRMLPRQ